MALQGDPNYPVYLGLRTSVRQVFEDTDPGWASLATGKQDRAVTTEATKLYFNWLQTGNVDAFTTLVNDGNARARNERQSLRNLTNANNTASVAALAGLGTDVPANRASARSRALEAGYENPDGSLRESTKRQIARQLEAGTRQELQQQFAAARGRIAGRRAASTRRKTARLHTPAAMPARTRTRTRSPKMHVTPGGVRTSLALHRKRSAAARRGAGMRVPLNNIRTGRRGGAFLGSPAAMIKEAASAALKNVMKTYVKPAARKIAKAGVKAARGGAHRGVNSIANSGEKGLLALIGAGLTLPGQRPALAVSRLGQSRHRRSYRGPHPLRPGSCRPVSHACGRRRASRD
jgi:hypothetical protein